MQNISGDYLLLAPIDYTVRLIMVGWLPVDRHGGLFDISQLRATV